MGLIDEIEEEMRPSVQACKLGRFLQTLEPKEIAEIETIFTDKLYPVEVVIRVLTKKGYTGGLSVAYRHARKECACVN